MAHELLRDDKWLFILISRYSREVERAIVDSKTTSVLIAIPCVFSSLECMWHLHDRLFPSQAHGGGGGLWCLLVFLSLVLSGYVCYNIALGIIIQQVRRRWSFPQKSSSAEWERDAAKKLDDSLVSCTLKGYPRPIQIIIVTMVIPLVIASVLYGAFIYLGGHEGRFILVIATFALLSWYYRTDD